LAQVPSNLRDSEPCLSCSLLQASCKSSFYSPHTYQIQLETPVGVMGLLSEGGTFSLFGQQYYRGQSLLQPNAVQGTESFWVIGVLVTLVGATLTVVGFMLQKQSHVSSSETSDKFDRSGAPLRPYWLESRWLLGGLTWVIGNLVCWVALGLAPQTILAAINCWNIVITLAIAPWLLGEPVSKGTALSALLLAVGTGWVVTFGPKVYQQHTVVLIVEEVKKPQSMFAFAATFTFLMSMAVVAYHRSRSRLPPILSCFQFTAVSATFCWYASFLSKSTAKVLVASVQLHQSLYLNPVFWILAALFPICAASQIHFLNMGLKYGDAIVVIPMYEALSMTGQIVVGGLVFDEFSTLGPRQHAWFWPGVAIVLLGIASIAREAWQSEGSVDERIRLVHKQKDAEDDTGSLDVVKVKFVPS